MGPFKLKGFEAGNTILAISNKIYFKFNLGTCKLFFPLRFTIIYSTEYTLR